MTMWWAVGLGDMVILGGTGRGRKPRGLGRIRHGAVMKIGMERVVLAGGISSVVEYESDNDILHRSLGIQAASLQGRQE